MAQVKDSIRLVNHVFDLLRLDSDNFTRCASEETYSRIRDLYHLTDRQIGKMEVRFSKMFTRLYRRPK